MKIELANLHNPFSRPSSLAHIDPEYCSLHRITNRTHRRKDLKISIFAKRNWLMWSYGRENTVKMLLIN